MNIQGRFPLGLTGLISLLSKGLLRVFSSTIVRKHQFFGAQSSLWSHFYISNFCQSRNIPYCPSNLLFQLRFIFLGSKINTDGDCSHKIKRRLLLGRKVMTNLGSIFKSRDITLPTKVHLIKAMFFPVVVNEFESWIIKKAEGQRVDAFELWCWRRLLRVT